MGFLQVVARSGLDLVLPDRCAGCRGFQTQQPVRHAVCGSCRRELDRLVAVRGSVGTADVVSVGSYDGLVRRLLLAYKERGRVGLRHELGPRLADLIAAGARPARRQLVLVPVPSSTASRRSRGHEPVTALARVAASSLRRRGQPAVVLPCLRHARRVADQSELSATGRRANLSGAFMVRRRHARALAGLEVIVIDDIVTTGATAAEAVRAVRAAGGRVGGIVAVAATPLRHPRRQPEAGPAMCSEPAAGGLG